MRLLLHKIFTSSCPEVFCKKGILKKSAKFTAKQLRQVLFLNKVAGHTLLLLKLIRKPIISSVVQFFDFEMV